MEVVRRERVGKEMSPDVVLHRNTRTIQTSSTLTWQVSVPIFHGLQVYV
jgi:hypothetical protein